MSKGLLYFAVNSAFQHLTKIGQTTKLDVKDRGLSASNVPEDFDYVAVFKCDDVEWAENKVHAQFEGYRHMSKSGRKTEFFWSGCIQNAISYASDLKGVSNITNEETEEIEVVNQQGEQETIRTPRTTFEMIGLPVGTEIYYKNDSGIKAIVADNVNQVRHYGKVYTISRLAQMLFNAASSGSKKSRLNGYLFFYYNNVRLFDMRPDQQDNK